MSQVFFMIKCGEVYPPASIDQVAVEAIRLARKLNVVVEFSFNQVELEAWPNTKPHMIVTGYHLWIRHRAAEKRAAGGGR